MYDLQKADMWKRISAALFDLILLSIIVMGSALLMSGALGYDGYVEKMDAKRKDYEVEYGLSFDITSDEYAALPSDIKAVYDEAYDAFGKDEEAIELQNAMFQSSIIIVISSISIGYVVLEFIVPLILKNGQTLGKKVFGIGVRRSDGVRVTPVLMFARTVLGKCAVETLIPALTVIMVLFGIMGILGTILIIGILIAQIILMIVTKTNSPIHDLLAQTVTVDFASQMIFDTPDDLLEYKKRMHSEKVR